MTTPRAISIQFKKGWDKDIEFKEQAHKNKFIEVAFQLLDEDLRQYPDLIAADGCYPVTEAFETQNCIFLAYHTSKDSSIGVNKSTELKYPTPAKSVAVIKDDVDVEYLRERSGRIIRIDLAKAQRIREAQIKAAEDEQKAEVLKNTPVGLKQFSVRASDIRSFGSYRVLSASQSVSIVLFPQTPAQVVAQPSPADERPKAPEVTITFD